MKTYYSEKRKAALSEKGWRADPKTAPISETRPVLISDGKALIAVGYHLPNLTLGSFRVIDAQGRYTIAHWATAWKPIELPFDTVDAPPKPLPYRPHYPATVKKLSQQGASPDEIAKQLGTTSQTFEAWALKFHPFAIAYNEALLAYSKRQESEAKKKASAA